MDVDQKQNCLYCCRIQCGWCKRIKLLKLKLFYNIYCVSKFKSGSFVWNCFSLSPLCLADHKLTKSVKSIDFSEEITYEVSLCGFNFYERYLQIYVGLWMSILTV